MAKTLRAGKIDYILKGHGMESVPNDICFTLVMSNQNTLRSWRLLRMILTEEVQNSCPKYVWATLPNGS